MPKRNLHSDILLILLFTFFYEQSAGTKIRTGYNFLDAFEELKSDQSVVIAVAIEEDTRSGTLGNRETGTRRTLKFEIERVLWGAPVEVATILIPNTFVFDGYCWGETQS